MNEEALFKFCSYLISSATSGNEDVARELASMTLPVQMLDEFDTKSISFKPSIASTIFDMALDYYNAYGNLITKSVITSVIEEDDEWSREEKKELVEYCENIISFPGTKEEFKWALTEVYNNYKKNLILETTLSSTKKIESGVDEALSHLKSSANNIQEKIIRTGHEVVKSVTGTEMLNNLVEDLEKDKEIVKPCAFWGWKTWDSTIGGLYPEELTLLAAKPSVGKSFLAGELVFYNAFIKKKTVVYSTNELTKKQFEIRMLSRLSGVPLEKIRRNALTPEEKKTLKELLNDYIRDELDNLIIIPPLLAQTVRSIKQQTELLLDKEPDLHVVDHMSLLKADMKGVTDWREKEYNCDQLKLLAQEHNCAVYSPIHINREGAKEEVIRLENVQYQSYIQRADNIIMLNQHKDYPSLPPKEGEYEGTPGVIIATIERARSVPTGTEKYLLTEFSRAAVTEPSPSVIMELMSPKNIQEVDTEKEMSALDKEFDDLYEEFGE